MCSSYRQVSRSKIDGTQGIPKFTYDKSVSDVRSLVEIKSWYFTHLDRRIWRLHSLELFRVNTDGTTRALNSKLCAGVVVFFIIELFVQFWFHKYC
jgi:hypothetical protein